MLLLIGQFLKKCRPNVLRKCSSEFKEINGLWFKYVRGLSMFVFFM